MLPRRHVSTWMPLFLKLDWQSSWLHFEGDPCCRNQQGHRKTRLHRAEPELRPAELNGGFMGFHPTKPNDYSGVVSIMHQKFVESGSPGLCSKPPWNLSLHLGMWMYLRKLVCMCVRLCDIHIKVHSSTLAKLIPNRFTVTCFKTVQPLQGPSRVYPHPRGHGWTRTGTTAARFKRRSLVHGMLTWFQWFQWFQDLESSSQWRPSKNVWGSSTNRQKHGH